MTVDDSILFGNKVIGVQPSIYLFPLDSTIDFLFIVGESAGEILGAPTFMQINPAVFELGGGAASSIIAGVMNINRSLITENSSVGDGGGVLSGGVTGTVSLGTETAQSVDYAAISINQSLVLLNSPDNTARSDLANVGTSEATGVYLQVSP